MGCSSGMVSSLTSMMGGWKVWTIDSGRPELLLFRPLGLLAMGVSTGVDVWIGVAVSRGGKGIDLRCDNACRGFGPSWGGDELGVDRLESLLLCPDNWDMNEKTGNYRRVVSVSIGVSVRASAVDGLRESGRCY